jgi:ABC-type transport system substrate-binding protein
VKKFLFISLALLLALSFFAVACGEEPEEPGPAEPGPAEPGPSEPEEPEEPYGTLRVSMPNFAYETFDYIEWESFFGWSLYDPLVTWNRDLDFVPAIATGWEVSEDALTWTFTIRDDVYFHNGDKLTSADVMFSIEHMQDPTSTNPWSPYLSYNFDSHYCPDETTYVYKTVEPEHPLIMCFASTRILPKDYIETNGWDYFKEHPIGSGPWKYVEFISGDHITMEANSDHWRTPPHFKTLIQYVVPEEATQIAMLKRDEVDIITGISLDRALELGEEGWRLVEALVPMGSNVIMPGTWLTDGPTSDIRVRRALAAAIDYQEICDTLFHGYAEPGGRFFHYPGMFGWDDSWQPEQYDPALAASLLAEAGYPDAFDDPVIHIYIQTGTPPTPDLFQILQGYWTAAGIQTDITMVDAFEMAGLFFFGALEGDNIGAIIPWVYGNSWPTNVYHSKNMYCPGGVHSTSNDATALELYLKAVNEPDPDLVEQYYSEFLSYVHDELFINFGVCLIWPQNIVGPEIGDFGWGQWMDIADSYADIGHS